MMCGWFSVIHEFIPNVDGQTDHEVLVLRAARELGQRTEAVSIYIQVNDVEIHLCRIYGNFLPGMCFRCASARVL